MVHDCNNTTLDQIFNTTKFNSQEIDLCHDSTYCQLLIMQLSVLGFQKLQL